MAWEVKELDEVCHVEYGTRVVQKRDGGTIYPVYGGGGATFFMDESNREDCLIIARFAMSEKCTRFVKGKFFLNDSGLSIIPKNKNELFQEFLNYQILFLNNYIYSLGRGTAQKNLDVPKFRKTEIHFPKSIEEQKQIVSLLDSAFEKIAKAKENSEQNLKNAKEVFESYLQSVFENKGEGWEENILGDISDELFAGGDVPKDNFSKFKTEKYQIPIFSNGEKNKGLYGYTNKIRVSKPSITISARGTIGYSEVRTESFFPVVRLIVLIPNTNIITLSFLKYVVKNIGFINSGVAIPQLTVPMIKKYFLSYPKSIEEQKEIVSKLDSLSEQSKKLESIYTKKLTYLEELKQSILQKAFNGELTEISA